MQQIEIQTGVPTKSGMYVVYTESELPSSDFPEKRMLMYMVGSPYGWWYPSSDQTHRGVVYGWVGPLPTSKISTLRQGKRKERKFAIGHEAKEHGQHFTGGPFDTLKEALDVLGEEGECLCRITRNSKPKILRKWENETWERVKK